MYKSDLICNEVVNNSIFQFIFNYVRKRAFIKTCDFVHQEFVSLIEKFFKLRGVNVVLGLRLSDLSDVVDFFPELNSLDKPLQQDFSRDVKVSGCLLNRIIRLTGENVFKHHSQQVAVLLTECEKSPGLVECLGVSVSSVRAEKFVKNSFKYKVHLRLKRLSISHENRQIHIKFLFAQGHSRLLFEREQREHTSE